MIQTGTAASYRVFVRNWWRWEYEPADVHYIYARGRKLVPNPGARKTTLAVHCTREEALRIAQEYNATHKPGPLSRKAEFESES